MWILQTQYFKQKGQKGQIGQKLLVVTKNTELV